MENNTLGEVFIGVKPDIGHLHIFGCLIYFHVPKEKRNKFEATRRKGMFLGYCENSKSFRIYIPNQRKVEISRHVTYDEE